MRTMRGAGLGEKGFTLIELIVIIVILGILAATAIPKFVDLREEAARGVAEGTLGAARSFAAMNFSKNLLNAGTMLKKNASGETWLLGNLETDGDASWSGITSGTDFGIQATISGTTYKIVINTAETTTSPAKLILQP